MKSLKHILIINILMLPILQCALAQNNVSKNVIIPKDSLYIKSLDRYQKLRIFLPPSYQTSKIKYPVLYMTDAQNLFDPKTSYAGEWNVDETLDSLYKADGFELIVIGMDHGDSKRMTEYSPWDNIEYGNGEGKMFADFMVNELKPYIDKKYRTLSDNKNTGIMGSSMGGLIAHYISLAYPDKFAKAGVFSPSYWYSRQVYKFTKKAEYNDNLKFYILIEGYLRTPQVKNVYKIEEILRDIGFTDQNLKIIYDQEAKHNEAFWRRYFEDAVKFLFY